MRGSNKFTIIYQITVYFICMLLKSALNQQFTETPIIQVILVIRHFHISHNGTLFAPQNFA